MQRLGESDLNKDGFVDWSEHKEAEFDGIDEGEETDHTDAGSLDDAQMLFEDKVS